MNNYDGIIFDIDGVLVETTKSYDEAIKKTVAYFSKKRTASDKDIRIIRSLPGFNNDWDLSFALVVYLQKGVIKKVTAKTRTSKKYQELKDIFQALYLGEKLFQKIYNRRPLLSYKNGLIQKEKLLFPTIADIGNKYILGIATSRPRFEALFTLQRFGITPSIINEENIIAMEDIRKDKPNPDSLLLAKRKMRVKNPLYVGDTINDVIAAKRARMLSIYIGEENLGDIRMKNINQMGLILN